MDERELLDKQSIATDILALERTGREHSVEGVFLISVLAACLILSLLLWHWIILAIATPIILFLIARIILKSVRKHETLYDLTNGGFHLEEATLEGIAREQVVSPYVKFRGTRSYSGVTQEHLVLYFTRGRYVLPKLPFYYAWSELCSMEETGIDHTSVPGNEFYVVINNTDSSILFFYNKKLFRLSEKLKAEMQRKK